MPQSTYYCATCSLHNSISLSSNRGQSYILFDDCLGHVMILYHRWWWMLSKLLDYGPMLASRHCQFIALSNEYVHPKKWRTICQRHYMPQGYHYSFFNYSFSRYLILFPNCLRFANGLIIHNNSHPTLVTDSRSHIMHSTYGTTGSRYDIRTLSLFKISINNR